MSEQPKGTVSRAAFFGGIFVGVVIFFVGFWFIPKLGLPGWASLILEVSTVAIALSVMTRTWRRSASTSVDTAPGDRDRGD